MGLGLAHRHPHLLRRQLCGLGQSLKRDEIMRSIFLTQLTFMCGIMSKSEKIHFLRNGFRIRDEIPPLVCLSPVEIWNRYPQRETFEHRLNSDYQFIFFRLNCRNGRFISIGDINRYILGTLEWQCIHTAACFFKRECMKKI